MGEAESDGLPAALTLGLAAAETVALALTV